MHKRSVELNLRQEFGKLVTRCQEISTKDLTSLEVFEILENFNGNTQNTISHFSNY